MMVLWKRLLLSLCTLTLTILLVDLGLSYLFHYRQVARWKRLKLLTQRFRRTPTTQWTITPNLKKHQACHPDTTHCNTMSTDKYGMRNPKGALDKAEFVFLGDSFFTPEWIERSQSLYAQFSKKSHRKVATVSASGWSLENYREAVRYYILPRKQIQHVVLGLYINDWHSYQSRNPAQKWTVVPNPEKLGLSPPWLWKRDLLGLKSLHSVASNALDPKGCKKAYVSLKLKNGTSFYADKSFYRQLDAFTTYGTLKTLASINKLLASASKKLTVLVIPDALAVYSEEIQSRCRNNDGQEELELARRLVSLVKRLGDAKGFSVVDALPILRSHKAQSSPLYLSNDIHWSPMAHKIVGNALSKHFGSVALR